MHRVTVLIACYNDEEFIGGAIKSALEQNYTGPVTVCVIDDGSTDSSSEIAKSHFTKPINDCEPITVLGATFEDCCITFQENMGKFGTTKYIVIEKPNGGPSDARNWGISYTFSDTDIYAILDSDDEMYYNKITACVHEMSQDMESIGVVYGDYDTYHIDVDKKIREFKEPYSRKRLTEECIVHSGSFINKKALESVCENTGFYDVKMRTCEDYDLWMRISEKYVLVHIPESLTLVRVTGGNSSFIVNQDVWQQNWSRVMKKMQDRAT